MNSEIAKNRLQNQLLLAVMRMSNTAVWVNSFIALGVTVAVATYLSPWFWLWLAILLPFNLGRLPIASRILALIDVDDAASYASIDRLAFYYLLLTLGSGLCWSASTVSTILLDANSGMQVFMLTTSILIAAGSHATLSVMRSLHMTFVLAILVPIIAVFAVLGFNSWTTMASAGFLAVYVVFISNSGRAYVRELRSAHTLRFQYEDLARDLAESRDEIHAGRERLRVTFAAIEDGIITADEDFRIDYVNGAAEQLLGTDRLNLIGVSLEQALPLRSQTDQDLSGCLVERLREDDKSWFSQGFRLVLNSNKVDIELSASLIRSTESQVIGAVLVLHDSSALRDLNRRMSYEAAHDPLTGLQNRRGFNAAINKAWQDQNTNYTLCYLDLDDFKRINDVAGHGAGDKVLVRVVEAMKQQLRDADLLARVGGDEFALLLHGCAVKDAGQIIERLRLAVSGVMFEYENVVYTLGVSIGMVDLLDYTSPELALEAADSACYEMKAGRRQG